ncbi:unnamed protein product [Closterium sp. NIES-53]
MLLQNPERFRSECPLSERTLPERLLASCFPFCHPLTRTADPVSSLEAADDVSVRLADANHALHDSDNDEDDNNEDVRSPTVLPFVLRSSARPSHASLYLIGPRPSQQRMLLAAANSDADAAAATAGGRGGDAADGGTATAGESS